MLGLSVRMLDPLRDIDTIEDVQAEWPRLRPLLAGTALEEVVARSVGR